MPIIQQMPIKENILLSYINDFKNQEKDLSLTNLLFFYKIEVQKSFLFIENNLKFVARKIMKKLFTLMLCLSIFIFMVSCTDQKNLEVHAEFEEAMQATENLTTFEMKMTIGIDINGYFQEESVNIQLNSAKKQMAVTNNQNTIYILNDYVFNNDEISKFSWENNLNNQFDFMNNLSLDLDDAKIMKLSNENNIAQYQIQYSKKQVKKLIDSIYGDFGDKIDISNFKYIYTINKTTHYLQNINMTISISYEEQTVAMKMNVDLLPMDNNKEIIPEKIKTKLLLQSAPKAYLDTFAIQENSYSINEPLYAKQTYTDNSILKYHNLTKYRKLFYDDTTKTIVTWVGNKITIYDAFTLTELRYTYSDFITDCDAGDGYIAVCSDTLNKVIVFDNQTLTKCYEFTPKIEKKLAQVAVSDGYVFYTEDDQRCSIYMINFKSQSKETYVNRSIYQPKFIVDRERNLLYAYENGISRTTVIAYNLYTGKTEFSFEMDDYLESMYFDGEYFHMNGDSINSVGEIISKRNLTQLYPSLSDFTPTATIYNGYGLSIVRGFSDSSYQTAVYDESIKKFIAVADFNVAAAIPLGDKKYILTDREGIYCAILDVSNCSPLPNHIEPQYDDATKTSITSIKKIVFPHTYDKIKTSENYIFTLCSNLNCVKIYDRNTLQHVKTLTYLSAPVDFDYDNGYLAVVLGKAKRLYVYDVNTWKETSCYIKDTYREEITSVNILGDTIYCLNAWHKASIYNIKTKEMTYNAFDTMSDMALHRETQTLYYFEMYDLYLRRGNVEQELIEMDFKSERTRPIVAGNYLLAGGYIFEIPSIKVLDSSAKSLLFFESEEGEVIWYDGSICVYLQTKDTAKYTVIYDTKNKKVLDRLDGIHPIVIKQGNQLYVGEHCSNNLTLYILTNQS